jgi:hypothetical protein
MTPQQLLEQCRNGVHILHESHYMAAKRYEAIGRMVGLLVVLLSAAAGATVLQGLSGKAQARLVIITGLAAFTASALAAVQTFLAYPALAERHRTAAHRYGDLRREFERLLVFLSSEPSLESRIAQLQTRWNEADAASPTVPQYIIRKAPKRIEKRRRKMAAFRSKAVTGTAPASGAPTATGS